MRMYDIIEKKRDNYELTKDEINFLLENIVPIEFLIIRCQLFLWLFFE